MACNRNNANLGYVLQHNSGGPTCNIEDGPVPGTDANVETFLNASNDGGAVQTPDNADAFGTVGSCTLPQPPAYQPSDGPWIHCGVFILPSLPRQISRGGMPVC